MHADYPTLIRHVHLACVALSGGLFAVRGATLLLGFTGAMRPALRHLSYTIDTVLLASAIGLAISLSLNPLTTPWLALKITLLLAYIVLGSLALKRAPTRRGKALAYCAALGCFAMIVAVAHLQDGLFR